MSGLRVSLVVPDAELWSGTAAFVLAKTLDGDIGILRGHVPVFGVLAEPSLVLIRPNENTSEPVIAAVSGGFFSVADDRVSILARHAQLGALVDQSATRAALDSALQAAAGAGGVGGAAGAEGTGGVGGVGGAGAEEPPDARYYRALLQAAADSGTTAGGGGASGADTG